MSTTEKQKLALARRRELLKIAESIGIDPTSIEMKRGAAIRTLIHLQENEGVDHQDLLSGQEEADDYL